MMMKSATECDGQAAESKQQQCWTAAPRKHPHDKWRCGNLAHAPLESTSWTGCGASGERSPERPLTCDASNERIAEATWWTRGIVVRFPQRLVAKTFAQNVEVEVLKVSSLFQCAFFTEQTELQRPSIFELALLLRSSQQLYAVSVRLRSFRCRSRNVGVNSARSALYSASLVEVLSNQPKRVVGVAGTLQSSRNWVRTWDGCAAECRGGAKSFLLILKSLFVEKRHCDSVVFSGRW